MSTETHSRENVRVVKISSSNRSDKTQDNGNFQVNFISGRLQNVHRVVIESVSLPNLFYNINEHNNTLIFYDSSDVEHTVTIPVGQYKLIFGTSHTDADDLFVALKAVIDPLLGANSITFTLNPVTKKITAILSGGAQMTFFNSLEAIPNGMSDVIGYTQDSVKANAFTFADFPALDGATNINLYSTALASGHGAFNSNLSTVPIIPAGIQVGSSFGSFILWRSNDDDLSEITYENPVDLTTIDFQIRDEYNRLLSLGKNHHMEVYLRVYYSSN